MAGKEPSKGPLLLLEGIVRDLRLSCRNLAKNPGFTIVVIVTLALGNRSEYGGLHAGRHARVSSASGAESRSDRESGFCHQGARE